MFLIRLASARLSILAASSQMISGTGLSTATFDPSVAALERRSPRWGDVDAVRHAAPADFDKISLYP
jgi:hypothetical protein